MEHDPLGTGGNAIMALIEGRETGQDCIIVVGHIGGIVDGLIVSCQIPESGLEDKSLIPSL